MKTRMGWGLAGIGAVVIAYGCAGTKTLTTHGGVTEYGTSVERMEELARGMTIYANDYDDLYPPTDRWVDAIDPYVRFEGAFNSPAVEAAGGRYGYAFNAALAGNSTHAVQDPYDTVLIFDSTVLARNATAPTSTMPAPPRYGTRNTISYVTGRVQDGEGSTASVGQVALSRVRHLSIGAMLYSGDYDDFLPLANKWVDGTMPYVRVDQYYRSPALKSDTSAYGFALSADVAGRQAWTFESAATTPSIFDSTILTRNATALPSTRPNPPRYPEGNATAFLDGHVNLVP